MTDKNENRIDWSIAEPMSKSITVMREKKLVSFWCAGFVIPGGKYPILLANKGGLIEFGSYEAAIDAARKVVDTVRAERITR